MYSWLPHIYFVAEDVPPATFTSQALASQRCLYLEWWASSAEPPGGWAGAQPVSYIFSSASYFLSHVLFHPCSNPFQSSIPDKMSLLPSIYTPPHAVPRVRSSVELLWGTWFVKLLFNRNVQNVQSF